MQKVTARKGLFRSIEQEKRFGGYVFVFPWAIGFLTFFVYPLIKTILLSFADVTSVSGLRRFALTGLGCYQRAFVFDTDYIPMFLKIVGRTVVDTVLILIFALFVALLLNKELPGKGMFRAVFFLPVILGTGSLASTVIGSDTASSIMAIDTDVLTTLLDADLAKAVMDLLNALSMVFWHSSVQIVIYLSGLQGIPDSLYESADCDGATAWETFWKITLPMLAPVTVIDLIYTIIDSFTSSENELLAYIYDTAFLDMDLSYAAAMGVLYLVFVFLFTGIAYACVSGKGTHAWERS